MTESKSETSAETLISKGERAKFKVLHVDDDPICLKVAQRFLEAKGYFEVETACSAEEAMEKMKGKEYDAVVSDYMMPGKDGLQFLKELREEGNGVPFIIFTGKGREELAIKALNLGADGYFNKFGAPETVYGGLAHYMLQVLEKKRAADALREIEIRDKMLLENIPQKVFFKDRNSVYISCNENYARDLRIKTDEIKGKTDFDFFPKELAEKYRADDQRIMKSGKKEDIEEKYIQNGQETLVHTVKTPVKDGKGNIVGLLGIFWDVTESKKAEEKLRESEERYRMQFEEAIDAIFLADAQTGIILDCNRAATELVGREKSELIGEHQRILHPPKENEGDFSTTFKQHLKEKEGQILEAQVITKNGEIKDVAIKGSLFEFKGKKVIQGIFRDITNQKAMEEALRKSEEQYRVLFNSSNDAVLVHREMPEGMPGKFVEANDAALQILGYTREELLGLSPLNIVAPEDLDLFRKHEEKFHTEKRILFEITLVTKEGRKIPFEVNARLFDLMGQPVVLTIARNITERKRIEEELRESERQTRILMQFQNKVIDTPVVWINLLDLEGNITLWNRAAELISGYSREEVIGHKKVWEWLYPDPKYRAEIFAQAKQLIGGEREHAERRDFQTTIRCKDGTLKDISWYGSGILDDEGKPIGSVVLGVDITERRKAEEALRNSEERLNILFELAPDAYYISDLKGNFVDGNKAAEEITGYTRNELIGKNFLKLKLLPRSQALKAAKLLATNALGKPTGPDEFILNRKDGTQVPVEIRTYPVKIKNETVVLGIARDITVRKKEEQAVRESKQKFEGLFMHNPEASVYLDSDFRILDVNSRFCALFGYSKKEVEGKTIDEVVVPEGMLEEAERLNKDAEKGYAAYETVRKRKDGSLVDVSISVAPVTAEGKLLGYIGVYKDISHIKSVEEHLREINKQLEFTNEKLSVVGGLTRHDVRNKLSVVAGNAYLLRERVAGDPEALEYLKDIDAAIRQVEKIFEFARTYERIGVEQLLYMDVGKTVDEAVSLFSDLKGVKIANECGGLTVLADSLLRQLFYNLIDNSLKHGEKTQHIRVHYKMPSADQLELVYEDDGVGIPDNMRDSLFREGAGKGTGLGLFMIKRICEVYGWVIRETGKQGKGAQFTMTISRSNQSGKINYKLTSSEITKPSLPG